MKQLIYNLLHGWLADNCDRHYAESWPNGAHDGGYESCLHWRCRLAMWIEYNLMPDWWYEL